MSNNKNYEAVIKKIDELMSIRESIIICIEGNSSSGKTTLSGILKEKYSEANVFHMDEFFLQPHQRSPERLAEIGGNIDYIRLNQQVINNLINRQGFYYERYSCKTGRLTRSEKIMPARINIIEGVYSMHPLFRGNFDLIIFLSVDQAIQRQRIFKRNGERMLERYEKEWIPLENRYFKTIDIPKECDLFIDTSNFF